ncbi:unnamed protein product, partial [Prorocentrum cordatum]
PQAVGRPAGPASEAPAAGPAAALREQPRLLAFEGSGALLCRPSAEAVGRGGHRPNAVRNSRFTPLTWLPKSLFEQFRRTANVFFLCVSVLVFIEPVISWLTCTAFFVAVLLWTALKDLYEDLKKRRDDDVENSRPCQRYDPASGSFVQVQWRDIVAGDLILSLQDEALPADALIVQASDEQAFVSTVNLDGETNLKAAIYDVWLMLETCSVALPMQEHTSNYPDHVKGKKEHDLGPPCVYAMGGALKAHAEENCTQPRKACTEHDQWSVKRKCGLILHCRVEKVYQRGTKVGRVAATFFARELQEWLEGMGG